MYFIYYLCFFSLLLVTQQQQIGLITTFAGNGATANSGDGGPATSAALYMPFSVYLNRNELYLNDRFSRLIRVVDANTNTITTYVGNNAGTNMDNIHRLNVRLNGSLEGGIFVHANYFYFSDYYSHRIRRLNMTSGIMETYAGWSNFTSGYSGNGGPATDAKLNNPTGLYIFGNYVWIVDRNNFVIRRVDMTTTTINKYAGNTNPGSSGDGGPATSAQLSSIRYIFVDSSYLWIPDAGNNIIRIVSHSSNIITTFAGNGTGTYFGDGGNRMFACLNSPHGIFVDYRYIWISDYGSYRVRKIRLDTSIITTVVGNHLKVFGGDGGLSTAASIRGPMGLWKNEFNLYIVDQVDNRIRRVVVSRPSLWGDPHFVGLSGGKYTIDLQSDHCYHIFSSLLFNWSSCIVKPGHRSSTYLGRTTFHLEGHKVIIPLLNSSVAVIVDNRLYSKQKKFNKVGKLSSFRIYRDSINFKTPCLRMFIQLRSRLSQIRKRPQTENIPTDQGKYYYSNKRRNHFDFSILSYEQNNIGCKGATGLIGVTWNKYAKATGHHGEGVIKGKLSDYEVMN